MWAKFQETNKKSTSPNIRFIESDTIHRFNRQCLNDDSIIPARSWNSEIAGGTYRKAMVLRSDDPGYRKRQIVETPFSVLKRKFSADLDARRSLFQMKVSSMKMIICDLPKS